jgi:hypothetical protein
MVRFAGYRTQASQLERSNDALTRARQPFSVAEFATVKSAGSEWTSPVRHPGGDGDEQFPPPRSVRRGEECTRAIDGAVEPSRSDRKDADGVQPPVLSGRLRQDDSRLASEPRAGVQRGGFVPRCRLRVATGCTGGRGSKEPGFEQARRQTKCDLRAGRLSASKMRALRVGSVAGLNRPATDPRRSARQSARTVGFGQPNGYR